MVGRLLAALHPLQGREIARKPCWSDAALICQG
jgi:hypothetical protein